MLKVYLTLLLSLPIIFSSCTNNSNPITNQPIQDEILYVADFKLYLLNLETGEETFVTDSVYGNARWSPDGKWIAYNGPSMYEGSWQIYIVRADGSGKRIVTLWERNGIIEPHPDGGFNPVWSPDGQRIAFDRCINCELGGLNYELFIVDLDTSKGLNEIRLTNNIYPDLIEDWNDDEKILYRSSHDPDGRYDRFADFYIINIANSMRERLLKCDSLNYGYGARYSPDGEKVAYICKTRTSNSNINDIYIMNRDGTGITKITDNNLQEQALSWSSEGKRLVLMAGSWSKGGQLYIINVDGTGLKKITTDSRLYLSPDWRPYVK